MKKIIFLSELNLALSPLTRAEISEDTVREYAEAYKGKEKFPEPILYQVGNDYIVGDGMHRINAMRLAGIKAATFEVRAADREFAIKFALQSNVHHGLRRTGADKRQCATTAIKEFPAYSNREIANICVVSDDLVGDVRKEMEVVGEIEKRTKVIDRSGRSQSATKAKSGVVSDTRKPENKGKN